MPMAKLLNETCERIPNKCGGRPVLRGTRFPVSQLLAELADGRSVSELAEDFDLDLDLIREFLLSLALSLDRVEKMGQGEDHGVEDAGV